VAVGLSARTARQLRDASQQRLPGVVLKDHLLATMKILPLLKEMFV
jgi:hypothetical protein